MTIIGKEVKVLIFHGKLMKTMTTAVKIKTKIDHLTVTLGQPLTVIPYHKKVGRVERVVENQAIIRPVTIVGVTHREV